MKKKSIFLSICVEDQKMVICNISKTLIKAKRSLKTIITDAMKKTAYDPHNRQHRVTFISTRQFEIIELPRNKKIWWKNSKFDDSATRYGVTMC